ncbi:hypothetical protein MYAM1_002766 [Malassezia yamatoensis]|uniref:Major facilitator superfamily (MFS) profile domain-containing protein n=1 Tax=Malassezia yamatoensis TaxID=253288 RepID=A0AAJ6CHM0_9BASI|nr:hypothetical protein MYAM1_002766 [Malassezia yamatoensis]
MSNQHTGEAGRYAGPEDTELIEVPGTPELTVADKGKDGMQVVSETQPPPKQVRRPTQIDLSSVPNQPGTGNEDSPPTPNYTYAETDEGRLAPVFEGAGPGYEPEQRYEKPRRSDGKIELSSRTSPRVVGTGWPSWKKWMILCVVFMVQVSMNFNTSVYPNAVELIGEDQGRFRGVSEQGARVGQMIFLVAYAFGSELWAPWSEELGRWPVMQLSLFLVNLTQVWAALAPNFSNLIAARFFGGLCTAGGSVTLGIVADLFDVDDQQYAVAFIVLSSVMGTSVGPLVGGFISGCIKSERKYLTNLYWIFWVQLIFGVVTQLIHLMIVPETRETVLLDREAKRRRKAGETNVYGPNELEQNRFSPKKIFITWFRPFDMLVREPIVLCLSLLSGFSDALIFVFSESFTLVFEQWNFSTVETGLTFIPINIGYIIAFFSFFPSIHSQRQVRRRDPDLLTPESRLWWLLFTAPLEPLGLFGFAWTSLGPPKVHWVAPMIFEVLIAIANYAIYMATIDYMVAAYGPYAASATGGNALARDFLAGISAMFAVPMYSNIGTLHTEWASTILAILAVFIVMPVYLFYWKGEQIRARSPFAQEIMKARKTDDPNLVDPPEKVDEGIEA